MRSWLHLDETSQTKTCRATVAETRSVVDLAQIHRHLHGGDPLHHASVASATGAATTTRSAAPRRGTARVRCMALVLMALYSSGRFATLSSLVSSGPARPIDPDDDDDDDPPREGESWFAGGERRYAYMHAYHILPTVFPFDQWYLCAESEFTRKPTGGQDGARYPPACRRVRWMRSCVRARADSVVGCLLHGRLRRSPPPRIRRLHSGEVDIRWEVTMSRARLSLIPKRSQVNMALSLSG